VANINMLAFGAETAEAAYRNEIAKALAKLCNLEHILLCQQFLIAACC